MQENYWGVLLGTVPGFRAGAEKQDGQREKLNSKAVVTKPSASSGARVGVGGASEHPALGPESQTFTTLSLNVGLAR